MWTKMQFVAVSKVVGWSVWKLGGIAFREGGIVHARCGDAMETGTGLLGKKILLVDDDPSVRESLRLMLCFDHHTVTEAATGQEALRLFGMDHYDLVITDYLLPGMLGDELVRQIKRLAPTQPVCIVTAYLEKFANGAEPADVVLGKPLSLEELRRVVGLLIRRVIRPGFSAVEAVNEFRHGELRKRVDGPATSMKAGRGTRQHTSFRRWGIND